MAARILGTIVVSLNKAIVSSLDRSATNGTEQNTSPGITRRQAKPTRRRRSPCRREVRDTQAPHAESAMRSTVWTSSVAGRRAVVDALAVITNSTHTSITIDQFRRHRARKNGVETSRRARYRMAQNPTKKKTTPAMRHLHTLIGSSAHRSQTHLPFHHIEI